MADQQEFWPVECPEGAPNLFVCMGCMNEVYCAKIPKRACPACGGVLTFEAFTLDSIVEWGSEEIIHKATQAKETFTPSDEQLDSSVLAKSDSPSDQSIV